MTNPKKRIVVVGGGTGLSTLLRGLKKYEFDITAIVTVADDGGSSGRLRDDYDIPPPGDVRNVIAALSDVEPRVEKMFQYRFRDSAELGGHSLGNLMLTALTDITGDFSLAIAELSKVLNVNGVVLPASNKKVTLFAELTDGSIIEGESNIPKATGPINRVYISPSDALPLDSAVQAIIDADVILIGPGSLYTSIIPNLLVKGIQDAILFSKAEKIYICNLMTQKGETIGYSAYDHVKAIHNHVGKPFIDAILINKEDVPVSIKENYLEEKAVPVVFDIEQLLELKLKIFKEKIAKVKGDVVRHDSDSVAKWLSDYIHNGQKVTTRLS